MVLSIPEATTAVPNTCKHYTICYRVMLTQIIGLVLLGTHQSSHAE